MILHTFADEPPSKLVDEILRAEHAKRQLELFTAHRLELTPEQIEEYMGIAYDARDFHAPLQTPNATWQDRERAQRNGCFNENLRRVEAETPLEPDAAIAAERVPSPVRRVALAVGRWLVAFGEAS